MEIIQSLLTRFRRMGALFLIGIFLVIYIAIGIVYFQQGSEQRELEEQIITITRLSLIVAKDLPSDEELRADDEKLREVNLALAPMTDSVAIAKLVSIAEKSGIDVDKDAGKLRISPATVREEKRGGSTYQVLSFTGITVQGDYDKVMAFIRDLDSGETLETMVLKKVTIKEVEVIFVGEEGARRAEFRDVAAAVSAMMADNGLHDIPVPMSRADGVASNLMGDDPDTEETVEGFPDITTLAVDKGYTGTGSPRDGYVLYGHDKISTDDTTTFSIVSYITILTTTYYYTCEADGTVRQFDGANVARVMEYVGSEESKTETVVIVDVDIYTKLQG